MKARIRTLAAAAFAVGVVAVVALSVVQPDIPAMHGSDKARHLSAYLCLALAGGIAFPGWRSLLAVGLGLVAMGIGLEFVQAFIPGRMASAGDVAANTAGVALGLTVAWIAGTRARLSV